MIKRASYITLAMALAALFSMTAQAQSGSAANEDPVSRAIERIQKVADEQVKDTERMVASNKLLEEIAEVEQHPSPKETETISIPLLTRSPEVRVPGSISLRFDKYKESLTRILVEENVPVGLLAVAFVESGFNPLALSPKGARGIWQFMPSTARRYGLKVEPISDYRTDPEHSTRAAARYLRDLYLQFGDWELALAAYNAGENRIQKIIDEKGVRNFREMVRRGYLPSETRDYVPAVIKMWGLFEPRN